MVFMVFMKFIGFGGGGGGGFLGIFCSNSECPYHKKLRGTSEITLFPDPVPYMDENNVQHYNGGVDSDEKYLHPS